MTDCPPTALVRTSHLNAWSVAEASRALGVEVRTTDQPPLFPIRTMASSEAQSLVAEFFTEEMSLRESLAADNVSGSIRYPPSFPLALLDDKAAMSEWLTAMGERPIPFSTDLRKVMFPVFLKSRHSWVDGINRPRGWICRDELELSQALEGIAASGWSEDEYFAQQWLGDDDQEVFSVCGFFDAQEPGRNLLLTTRKVLGYTRGVGSSAVVATVPDPDGLIDRASAILTSLSYSGPFELEFLRHRGELLVIELNPRFWLQNGIFLSFGNGLMKRCLNADSARDWGDGSLPTKALWIDSLWIAQRLLQFDRSALTIVWNWSRLGYRLCLCPSLTVLLVRLIPRLIARRLRLTLKPRSLRRWD